MQSKYTSKVRLLADWTVKHVDTERRIELLQGDLSQLPPEHTVDILVVSALPNTYNPTPTSLMGALSRRGISVAELAQSKQLDMRRDFSCWLSHPIVGNTAFRQLLCVESGWRGTPPEITDDVFRALAPLLVTTLPNGSVAMPIIGSGDQGWPAVQMLEAILGAAVSWLKRGLPVTVLKIVVNSEEIAEIAKRKFLEMRTQATPEPLEAQRPTPERAQTGQSDTSTYDVFISYCHDDSEAAQTVLNSVQRSLPNARIFYDAKSLATGNSWLMDIAESLDNARRVAALFTPEYWASRYCKDEFAAALARQHDTGTPILFPIYVRTAKIPYLFRNIQYLDCREADTTKLADACVKLCQALM